MMVTLRVEAVLWYLRPAIACSSEFLPESFRVVNPTGKSTAHAHDGNILFNRINHGFISNRAHNEQQV